MSNQDDRWGIWYTDGEMDFGWLHSEGRHGRTYRIEDSKERIDEKVVVEQSHDPSCMFVALSLDASKEEFRAITSELREKIREKRRGRWA